MTVREPVEDVGALAARLGIPLNSLARTSRWTERGSIRLAGDSTPETPADDAMATADFLYVIARGDTLEAVARTLGVQVSDIVGWNPGIDPRALRPGQRIRVQVGRRVVRVVGPRESLTELARREGLTPEVLGLWNPGLRGSRTLSPGQRVVVRGARPPTESVGSAANGHLVNGRRLPPGPGYVLRYPDRSWATDETIAAIRGAIAAMRRRFPDVPRLRIHDLSLRDGGPIDDHASHRSGRDVDIVYVQRRCPGGVCVLRPVLPRQLALGPQWALLEYWLRRNMVSRIYIDYGLQEVLYRYARRHGVSRRELDAWFQYPRGRRADVGVIRHFPNHFDHVHVRFRCPPGDDQCR